MQWRKWLPKTGGGAFYSAKKWVGALPPLPHPFTYAPVCIK